MELATYALTPEKAAGVSMPILPTLSVRRFSATETG